MIDISKSSIHFFGKKNCWRSDIKSILSSENKSFFLVKECRAELIGEHPFSHPGKYEILEIVEDDKLIFIRTSIFVNKTGNQVPDKSQLTIKKNISETSINYLNFEEVYKIILSDKINNVYCEIEYEYEAIKYNLISKCEYVNFDNEKNNDRYLQPILGYVPFIFKNQIRYGYAVFNDRKNKKGYLEFLLNDKTPFFNINPKINLITLFFKKIFNILLFFIKFNNFTKLISIKEYKIKYFKYN